MKVESSLHGIVIESPLVSPRAANFRPDTWPPSKDFPVVIDATGKVLSRYGDCIWDLTPWHKKSLRIDFGYDSNNKGVVKNSHENAEILKQVVAWWIWGPQAVRTATTLKSRFHFIFPLFILCSEENIIASSAWRFPRIMDRLPSRLKATRGTSFIAILHSLYEQRDELGFTLLDRECLRRLEAALPHSESSQTPYIPPRIWSYQLGRLRDFLDDFKAHKNQIEDCFNFCIGSYCRRYGSLDNACRRDSEKKIRKRSPFSFRESRIVGSTQYEGAFSKTAKAFGIDELLRKWLLQGDDSLDGAGRSISLLTSYFTMACRVGLAYILNLSMMRVDEAWSLKCNCLEIENDPVFGSIYLLHGESTKTLNEDNARWVVSPSVKIAIEVMAFISELRMKIAIENKQVPTTDQDIKNPYLITRSYEPWANCQNLDRPLSIRPMYVSYAEVIKAYPNLFDPEELKITEADLHTARLITPSLNNKIYAKGREWSLAWHQLRRTGAVNMQGSGIVSDASIQYQLKHAARAMSLYYGRGYSRSSLNDEARSQYIRTMYEVLNIEISALFTNRFVSPHGEGRKIAILNLVDPRDSARLTAAAKRGEISWRETLLGGCAKRGPCTYGGIDNVIRCGGGDGRPPCADALFDRQKKAPLLRLSKTIADRLLDAPLNSPYRESLDAQKRAVENALNVISQP